MQVQHGSRAGSVRAAYLGGHDLHVRVRRRLGARNGRQPHHMNRRVVCWRTRVGKLRAGGREGDRMDPAGAHLECTADTESRRQRQRMHRRMHTLTRAACCKKWEWYDGDEISVMCGAKSGVIRSRILTPPTHRPIQKSANHSHLTSCIFFPSCPYTGGGLSIPLTAAVKMRMYPSHPLRCTGLYCESYR